MTVASSAAPPVDQRVQPPRPIRHPGDLLRVGVGAVGLGVAALVAKRERLVRFEVDLFRLVNDLPSWLSRPLQTVMQAGSVAAVGVAVGVALTARRPRMARDLGLAGGGAWLTAKLVKSMVGRGRPGSVLADVIHHGPIDKGLGFPSGHVAVAAALAAAASTYLGKSGRRILWTVVAIVAVARVYVGAHLPVDAVGGAFVGWMVASLVHFALGAPDGSTDPRVIRRILAGVMPEPIELARAGGDARGSSPYRVVDGAGERYFVKSLSDVHRDNDVLFKLWRHLTLRHLEDEAVFVEPKQLVEHEALMSMLATNAGVLTPRFVTIAAERDVTVAVFDLIEARSLDTLDQAAVTDEVLDQVWANVKRLRQQRIAHRDLRLANIMLDDARRVWLVDFGFAESSATDHRLAQDAAELLASSAALVGVERAVRAGLKALGPEGLAPVSALLQPMALSAATRAALRADHGLLKSLQTSVAEAAGLEKPVLEPLARIRPRTVVLLAGGLLAIHLLLPQVGGLKQSIDALRTVQPFWFVAAVLASVGSYFAGGLAQVGAVARPLSYTRTVAVQLAATFTNRLAPANLGGNALNVRYLQRSGVPRPEAVAAVVLNAVAGFVVHVIALVAVLIAVRQGVRDPVRLPSDGKMLVVVVAVLVGVGAVVWLSRSRDRLVPMVRQAVGSVAQVFRSPERTIQLFGGSAGVTFFYVLALYTSLEAFHTSLSVLHVTAVYLGAAAIASVAPTSGGLGAIEAALVAGLSSFGAPLGQAITGVLAFRLVTFWLPILPGWLMFRHLTKRGVV